MDDGLRARGRVRRRDRFVLGALPLGLDVRRHLNLVEALIRVHVLEGDPVPGGLVVVEGIAGPLLRPAQQLRQ